LIWLALVAAVFVGGGAWFIARSMQTRAVVLVAGLAAVAAYWFIGKPGMPDEPLDDRLAKIEKQFDGSGANMSADALMALAEKRTREDPKNPLPHLAIGTLLEMSGQPEEALMAYESALRRDPNELEAVKKLANLRFQMTGTIDEPTSVLYHQWFAREPNEVHIGFFAGMGDWLAGRKQEAAKIWADVDARTPKDDPRRQMYAAMRQQFGVDALSPAPVEAPKPPG
jgi:cytochrome c-type biogenesis protein CcmH